MPTSTLCRLLASGVLLAALLGGAFTYAAELSTPQHIEARWAEINYQLPPAQQEAAFAQLASAIETALKAEPQSAALLGWQGITFGAWAGAKGGPSALTLVKHARGVLEQALSIAPNALDGSAQANLACLYYMVPGWPVGFGNKTKAEQLLKDALKTNPEAIEVNFYYGDFLFRQGRYAEAIDVLNKTTALQPRADHLAADEGRRQEAQALLEKAQQNH